LSKRAKDYLGNASIPFFQKIPVPQDGAIFVGEKTLSSKMWVEEGILQKEKTLSSKMWVGILQKEKALSSKMWVSILQKEKTLSSKMWVEDPIPILWKAGFGGTPRPNSLIMREGHPSPPLCLNALYLKPHTIGYQYAFSIHSLIMYSHYVVSLMRG